MSLVGHPPLMLRPPAPFSVAPPSGMRICPVHGRRRLADFDTALKAGFPFPGVPRTPTTGSSEPTSGCSPATTAINRSPPPGACTTNGVVEIDWVAALPTPAAKASARP